MGIHGAGAAAIILTGNFFNDPVLFTQVALPGKKILERIGAADQERDHGSNTK